jgi:uncharacterized membrane protein (UPF0127 family)
VDTKRYCVYNKAAGTFLSVGASVVDIELEPAKAQQMLIAAENLTTESSFWLKPFKSVPRARIVCPFDMIFMNKDLRVVNALELSPTAELPSFENLPTSALILPLHAVYSSRTCPGDQLIICAAEDLVRHLAHDAAPASSVSGLRNTKSNLDASRGPGPKLVNEPAQNRQAAGELQGIQASGVKEKIDARSAEEKRRLEFQAEEIDAVIAQVRSWAGELPRPKAPVSISAPAPTRKNMVSAVKKAETNGGSKPRVAEEVPKRKPGTERLEEPGKVETARLSQDTAELHTQDVESVVSQVLRWAEQTGRPIASPAISAKPPAIASSSAEPARERLREETDAARAAAVAENAPERGTNAVQPVEEQEEPEGRLTESWISGLLRWAAEFTHLRLGKKDEAVDSLASSPGSSSSAEQTEPRRSVRSAPSVHVKRLDVATGRRHGKASSRTVAEHIHSLRTRFARWLDEDSLTPALASNGDRRRSKRHPLPGLVAYYWTGGTPQAHQIGDISSTGFYLLTKERWVPDTMIRMTLQRPGPKGDQAEEAISVISRVVRWGENGVGYEFVASKVLEMSGDSVDRPNEARQRLY